MSRFLLKAAWLAFFSPLCAAQAFDAVDTLTPAGSGIYPAYPSEGIRPYEFWAQFGMLYDRNILRRTVGDNHELVSRLGLGGRWDQRVVGRQSVHLEGRLDGYVYDKNSELDNIGYAGLGEWRWELGNDLTGTVGVSRRKFQAALSEIQRAVRDPITETVVNTAARYAVGPHLGLRGGASFIVAKEVAVARGWAPTAKLNFQARLYRQHQVFEGDPNAALGVSPLRQEFIRGYRLGSYWEYTRQVHFTFALDHGERESNILGRNYTYNAATANVKYIFF